jgi:hypothetical protein
MDLLRCCVNDLPAAAEINQRQFENTGDLAPTCRT